MSSDQQLEQQLAEYFGWLEQHLGTTMSPPGAIALHSPTRRRIAWAAAASVVVLATTTAIIVSGRDSAPSIDSATTNSVAVPSTSVVPSTSPGASAEGSLWAPINLPDTMEVVGVYSGVEISEAVLRPTSQNFGRMDESGTVIEVQLALVVYDGSNGLVTDTEVRGVPATMLHPSETSVSVQWTDGDHFIVATTSGLTDAETLDLINGLTLPADPSQGVNPQSVGHGMTTLASYIETTTPTPWSAFVVHDLATDAYIWTQPGATSWQPGLLDPSVGVIDGVGRLFHDTPGNVFLVTDDATPIAIGHPPAGPPATQAEALAVAAAYGPATIDGVSTVRTSAEAKLLTLPSLREVSIDGRTLILRGGTIELPQAICLRDASTERCSFNYINQPSDPPAIDQMSITRVMLSGEWFIVGYNQGEMGLGSELAPRSQCIADAAGTVIEVLPDTRVDVDGREYFTAAVPPTVDYVRLCYLDDGTLVAASSGMLTRPVE
jgi:hypothetical protein